MNSKVNVYEIYKREMGREKKEDSFYDADREKTVCRTAVKDRCIDLQLTGRLLRLRFRRAGLTVKQIQKALGLECPQSIYRWLSGQALPSVENLYLLHQILGCSMENLLVTKDCPMLVRCVSYLTAL